MSDVTISLRPNGPLLVTGPVKLIDTEGKEYNLGGKEKFSLCRCGQTKNRPFCDGTHKECGWAAVDVAPQAP